MGIRLSPNLSLPNAIVHLDGWAVTFGRDRLRLGRMPNCSVPSSRVDEYTNCNIVYLYIIIIGL